MILSTLIGIQNKNMNSQKKFSSTCYQMRIQTWLIGFTRLRTIHVYIVYSNFGKGEINLVKISEERLEEEYDKCDDVPCLVDFKFSKPPATFYGELKENEEIQQLIGVETIKRSKSLCYIRDNQLPIFISSILLVSVSLLST